MNWPGMNSSRGRLRSGLFQFGAFESPRCATIGVLPIDERHAAVEIRNHDGALALVEMARQPEPGHEVDVLAIERESLQAVVAAIGDDEDWRCRARVHPDAVRLGASGPARRRGRQTCGCIPPCALYWLMKYDP